MADVEVDQGFGEPEVDQVPDEVPDEVPENSEPEQRRKMKSKATERSFNESWKKFVIFNCGTSEKMWVYNYNFAK